MMKFELTGNTIKKLLGAKRVVYRWHNKNKSGGNFGINIYFGEEFNRETDREITGEYNTSGEITRLSFAHQYQAGFRLKDFAFKTMDDLIKFLKWEIDYENGKRPSPPITEEEWNKNR